MHCPGRACATDGRRWRHLRGAGSFVARRRYDDAGAATRHRHSGNEGLMFRGISAGESRQGPARDLLSEGGVTIANIGPDKYNGRVIVDAATARTSDIAAAMVASGL